MKKGHGALLGACLALSLAGVVVPAAAQPACGNQGVAIEPMTVAEQAQAERLITDANAMFRDIAAEMNAMQAQMVALIAMPLPSPEQLVQALSGPVVGSRSDPARGQ
jgi:hypothetical protein